MRRNDHEYYIRHLGKSLLRHSSRTQRRVRARHYRIRHSCGCFGGHSHTCHHGFPAKDSRTLDRHQRWNYGSLSQCSLDDEGQSTVEFALVTFAFMGLCAGIASLWHALSGDALSAHGLMAASHHVILTLPGGLADIFLY